MAKIKRKAKSAKTSQAPSTEAKKKFMVIINDTAISITAMPKDLEINDIKVFLKLFIKLVNIIPQLFLLTNLVSLKH